MRSYRFRIGSLTTVGALLIGLPNCSSSEDTPKPSQSPAPAPVGSVDEAAASATIAATSVGRVASKNERGFARTILSNERAPLPIKTTAETAARLHLARHAQLLGTTEASIRDAAIVGSHDLSGGGSIVQFEQRLRGIEVFRSRTNVLLDADKNLVSIANSLAPASLRVGKSKFNLSGEAAVASAYTARAGIKLGPDSVKDVGPVADTRGYSVKTPGGALGIVHASSKQIYYPKDDQLVPAYYVEILGRKAGSKINEAWGIVVSADDGSSLYQTSLTQNDAFTYRVWADNASSNKIPLDGPIADTTPYPGGVADGKGPTFIPPVTISMEGFNHGGGGTTADPWLKTTDTVTFGNNVQAYSDRNQYVDEAGVTHNDGYDEGGTALDAGFDFRADLTSALTFDRIYNTAQAPNASVNQIKAAITQLFYTTNWMHDYWYDSGFDEKSKNAQLSNLGRGGNEGDPLHAEAQDSADGAQSNNANMSTLTDGWSPRMQMYVWDGLPNRQLTTTPGTSLTFPDGLGSAVFGAKTFNVTHQGVIVNDGTGTTSDACEAMPANSLMNRVAIVDRGSCNFTVKALNVIAAGGEAMILINNAAGRSTISPGVNDPGIDTGFALLSISLEDGAPLKTAVGAGTVNIHMVRGVETELDGTIDNTVVAHEWGHYLHHRLVLCGSQQCGGMSEGWADFNAIMMVIKSGDTFGSNVFPMAQYATAGSTKNSQYFGIRRAPYSEDFTKNPFTFKHVAQNAMMPTTAPLASAGSDPSEVHNVGEIWAETLFQAYVKLLAAGTTAGRSFDDTKRRMADYVVAGMKGAPTEPSFTEQRDAILRPIYMQSKTDPTRLADFNALAAGFAARGMGSGAVSPPISSVTLNEVKEDSSTKGALVYESYTLDDSMSSCDHDGILDAGEHGVLTVHVSNGGWETLTGSTVTVTSADTNLTFDSAGTATISSLEPYGASVVTIGVTAKATLAQHTLAPLTITLANANAVNASVANTVYALVNYDDKAAVSSNDDVESNATPVAWTPAHTNASALVPIAWSRTGDATNHYWHGDDYAAVEDELLVSPDLKVSSTVPFVMNFSHRYSFFSGANDAGTAILYYDGGVVEISDDGGTTWTDIADKGFNPGYTQQLFTDLSPTPEGGTPPKPTPGSNPLEGRNAFGGDSPGYPSYLTSSVNFGMAYAGKTVKIRFRVGAIDEGNGGAGWDLDNFSFGGSQFSSLVNTPFGAITNNSGTCSDGGTADGGSTTPDAGRPDTGSTVDASRPDTGTTADASGSDTSGDIAVSDAPKTDASTPADAARDTTTPPITTTGGGGPSDDSGCGCSIPGGGRSSKSAATMLAALGAISMVLRRRRRGTK